MPFSYVHSLQLYGRKIVCRWHIRKHEQLKNICYFSLLCFAVSINLHTGRMGFDVGAIIVLSTVIGFIVGIESGDNVVLTILAAMLTGMVLSILSGLVYILLRLPMMIVSLGMTLIYEAVAYWIVRSYAYGGNVETLQLKRTVTPELCKISDDITTMIIITAIAVILMVSSISLYKVRIRLPSSSDRSENFSQYGYKRSQERSGMLYCGGAASRRCRHSQLFIC